MGSVVFSSSYSTSLALYATYRVRISYAESYSSTANRTSLTITGVELQKEGNGTNWGSLPFFGAVKVNGTTLLSMNGGSSVRVSLDGGDYCALAIPSSGSVTVEHDGEGACTVSFALVGGFSYGGENYFCALYDNCPLGVTEQTQSVALTTHPRASSIASCPASAATQTAISLTVERNSPAFYHKASFLCGGDLLFTSEPFASSLACTIPRAWFSAYPSAAALELSVSVQTYTDASCSAPLGSAATAPLTVTADAGMKPRLSPGWASLVPYNAGAAAGFTGFIKGFSRAEASFDGTKIDLADSPGASIASYAVSAQGLSVGQSPYRTGVLSALSETVVCSVTDTRGRTASESFTLSFMDYAPPTLEQIEVFRCAADGTANEDAAYYSVKASVRASAVGGQNACSLTAAIAPSGGSYGAETALSSGAASVLGTISPDASYTVRLSASDLLGGSAVYYVSLPTRKWAMKFRPNGSGVAFGKAAETDGLFEVSGDWDVKLGRPLGIASGGTGADSAADARDHLGLGALATENSVPIALGGTGADNAADARANIGAAEPNESGAGYCRMPDGTLIQWGESVFSSGSTSYYGNSLYYAILTIAFPKAFVDTNYVLTGSGSLSASPAFPICQLPRRSGASTTACPFFWFDHDPRTFSNSLPLVVRWQAVGRWK